MAVAEVVLRPGVDGLVQAGRPPRSIPPRPRPSRKGGDAMSELDQGQYIAEQARHIQAMQSEMQLLKSRLEEYRDDILTLRMKLSSVQARHINWQPIEGARKDKFCLVGEFDGTAYLEMDVGVARYETDGVWLSFDKQREWNPTHWCELEEPSDE